MQHGPLEKSSFDRRISDVRRADIALVGIYEISKLLAIPARLEISFSTVLKLLASFLDMRHGLIALLDDKGTPEMVVGSGWSDATARRYFDRLPERAIGRIVVTKMPLVIRQMKKDPLFENWDFSAWGAPDEEFSFIGVPIKDRGTVIGTVTIDREHGNGQYFGLDEDVRFLSMIANLLGQTVRLQRLIASDREWLMHEQRRLEKTIAERSAPQKAQSEPTAGIIGNTPAIKAVLDKVRRVARSHSPVLLRGESGTGKELFARALHDWSPRHEEPFIAVNCAALAETVLESELFGHEKGSFTGATAQRKGRFELADKGTLFLDEIGEISPAFQAKLLRVLQLGEFERVGGTATIKIDVRLVAATNRNLEESVAKGDFRSDLYYRISVVPIFIPPLRDRKGDIPLLAREFLDRFNTENEAHLSLTESAMDVLASCYFPGNVRELENCIRRTATLANSERLVAGDFACRNDECLSAVLWKKPVDSNDGFVPLPIGRGASYGKSVRPPSVVPSRPAPLDEQPQTQSAVPPQALHSVSADVPAPSSAADEPEINRDRLVEAMETAGWVQAKAARILGLTPRQIGYALRKHAIPVKKF
ncbi:MAG: nif-specific transcriptional activator NifA [Steroidobacteraceae bacterium]|jgi:Nif-specific regulatory protein